MPESVTDRFTKKHAFIFLMVKNEDYYFDLDAIRDKHTTIDKRGDNRIKYEGKGNVNNFSGNVDFLGQNPLGKNPGSVSDFWDVTTKGNHDSHFASYNTDLIKKPILAGCPEGGIIYDPFMGTGTTALAALRSNRNFIGSEMSQEYCKIIDKNLAFYKSQLKLF